MEDITLEGWHGTTKKRKTDIEKSGFTFEKFDFSSPEINIPNDLGQGIYFYTFFKGETGEQNAYKYVHQFRDQIIAKEKSSSVVLKAKLKCVNLNLLDLDDNETKEYLLEFKKKYKQQVATYVNRVKKSGAAKRKNLDGILIELFIRKIEEQYFAKVGHSIKIIKKETNTEFDGIRSNFPNGTELCVRDVSCICLSI
ncbi:MAG: hypothetical protein L0I79_06620 [Atopostipes sp.]|nr:hypothetical protein [Atopostipes sp.]